jgi:exodeoxyribonuclease VII large subunit
MPNLEISDPDDSGNIPAYSVSELAGALKRTLETAFDHVRLRAEISKVTVHSSGHVYLTLKDDRAAIDGVIWKGQVRGLKTRPETGLDVIVTGKITTFPASSKYQIIIDSLAVAGIGALLAQLERLKVKLKTEGLFDPARKRPLPFAPKVIGVITSPTGAVIRDILHRIRDRWPCRVIVWPVVVQGDQAARQVIAALKGFTGGDIIRPDVLIIARGGGSVEDLWPFNDEALARAVAACPIPVISAIGHETDTSLIDFVADRRAPTPTAAAEMATPVLSELKSSLLDLERRRVTAFAQGFERKRERLALLARALPRPFDLIAAATQALDFVNHRLASGLLQNLNVHQGRYERAAGRLTPSLLQRPLDLKSKNLAQLFVRVGAGTQRKLAASAHNARLPQLEQRARLGMDRILVQKQERLNRLEQLRQSLNPDRPLNLGFARVSRLDGHILTSAQVALTGEPLELSFKDGKLKVVVGPETSPKPKTPKTSPQNPQASLF